MAAARSAVILAMAAQVGLVAAAVGVRSTLPAAMATRLPYRQAKATMAAMVKPEAPQVVAVVVRQPLVEITLVALAVLVVTALLHPFLAAASLTLAAAVAAVVAQGSLQAQEVEPLVLAGAALVAVIRPETLVLLAPLTPEAVAVAVEILEAMAQQAALVSSSSSTPYPYSLS